MYIPKAFNVEDVHECIQLVRRERFGILFAPVGGWSKAKTFRG